MKFDVSVYADKYEWLHTEEQVMPCIGIYYKIVVEDYDVSAKLFDEIGAQLKVPLLELTIMVEDSLQSMGIDASLTPGLDPSSDSPSERN